MYKSSSMTFAFKYIFIPVWFLGSLFGIFSVWNNDDQFSHDWAREAAVLFGWALVWLTVIFIRLRSVSATNDGIVIKTLRGQKSVSYNDIEWISQIALVSPPLLSLQYFDNKTGQSRKILIMLNRNFEFFNFNLLKEQEMTLYIRERIIATKPDYLTENEPSRWLPAVLVLLSGFPIVIINNFNFMNFF